MGSIEVNNTVAFTDADSASATNGQDAYFKVLNSGDVSSIFGDTFGTVTVTNVTKTNTSNPSKLCTTVCPHACTKLASSCLLCSVSSTSAHIASVCHSYLSLIDCIGSLPYTVSYVLNV